MMTVGQIGNRDHGAICRRFGLRTEQIAGIHAEKHVLSRAGKWGELDKDLAQSLALDLAVFKSFIDAGPFPLEKRRERQLRKAVSCRFTAQRVHRVEQRITGALKTAIDAVTKLVQYVKVHLGNAPFGFDTWNITRFGNPPQGWVAFLVQLV